MTVSEVRTYKCVYLTKLVMAFLVVIIHTTTWTMMGLVETAVPWFFMTSGFFLFGKMGTDKAGDIATIRTWLWKAIRLYLVWTVIYLPFAVIGFYSEGMPAAKAVAVYCRNVLLVGENYLSWPLWYLLALIWGGVFIGLMRRAGMPVWAMFLIGAALYVSASLLHLDDVPAYTRIFKKTQNGLFHGLMFMTGGGLVRQWVASERIRGALGWDAALAVCSFIAFQFSKLFLLPLTLGIFLLTIRIDIASMRDSVAKRLGMMSKVVYLSHMLFAGLLILLAGMGKGTWLFALTAACATIAALLYSWRYSLVHRTK